MQNNFGKRFLIGMAAVALVWAAIPLLQAQPCDEIQDQCDLVPEPSVPLAQSADVQKTASDSPVNQPEKVQVLQKTSETAPVQTETKVVVHKLREMDDHEMDGQCGGIVGSFDMTQSGNMTLNDNSTQNISLSDQAQQNLSSMVNILSVNSTISVMLNLNVNINSTVGTVNQGNTGTQNTGVQNTTTITHP